MINKITKDIIYKILPHIFFFIFLCFILLFVWIKFSYILSSNYFLLNKNYINKDIIIVAIDEKTLNSNNFKRFLDITRWDYADLLRRISYNEPKAILVDIVFSQIWTHLSDDERLLHLIKSNSNIVFATEFLEDQNKWIENIIIPKEKLWYINVISYSNINFFDNLLHIQNIKNAIPFYSQNLFPIIFKLYSIVNDTTLLIQNNDFFLWNKKVPLNKNAFHINFFTKNYRQISFIDIIEGREEVDFKDKIVFLWATAHDLHDEFLTPIDPNFFTPWVVILANAYNTITSWKYLYYPNWFIFLLINIVFLLGIFIFFNRCKNIIYSFCVSFWFLFIFLFFWIISFKFFWLFIEILPFIVGFIFLHIYLFIFKYLTEKKSKDEIRNIFWRYISRDIVNELVKTGIENLHLWWNKREVSVFFSDLAWFTDLSENLDPENLWKILNIYFEEMSNIILSHQWTIDKFIWDAIMAFWNAPLDIPNHADMACKAALAQRIALLKVRKELKNMGSDVFIDMRIGINTWEVVVWNFWCSQRYDYTILWDTVNLASRLEGINKEYATHIIINETTFQAITPDMFITRELDIITVKWKKKPVKIYELIWLKSDYKEKDFQYILLYKEALNFYKQKDFIKAREMFIKISDDPSKKFIERCNYYLKNPPPLDWDGVYRFKTK